MTSGRRGLGLLQLKVQARHFRYASIQRDPRAA
jgi:hypothetical protein